MLRQLKCAGIMEAIKIRKSGYSLRIPYEDFCERYALLVGPSKPKNKATCEEIVSLRDFSVAYIFHFRGCVCVSLSFIVDRRGTGKRGDSI